MATGRSVCKNLLHNLKDSLYGNQARGATTVHKLEVIETEN